MGKRTLRHAGLDGRVHDQVISTMDLAALSPHFTITATEPGIEFRCRRCRAAWGHTKARTAQLPVSVTLRLLDHARMHEAKDDETERRVEARKNRR